MLSMGRKGGKAQLVAALALRALSGPEAESRGEVYTQASSGTTPERISMV